MSRGRARCDCIPIPAGSLRENVVFQSKTQTSDGRGGNTIVFVDGTPKRAAIKARHIVKNEEGAAGVAAVIYDVTIRGKPVVDGMKEQRMKWTNNGNKLLQIISTAPDIEGIKTDYVTVETPADE